MTPHTPSCANTADDFTTICELYSDILCALRNAQTSCKRALSLAYNLDLPGSSALWKALDDTRDATSDALSYLDTADDALDPLRKHAQRGTLADLFAQCQNCTAWLACEHDCEHAANDDDDTATNAAVPCPKYEPIPSGCNCLRCQHRSRSFHAVSCTLDHQDIPCPGDHCCTHYAPASIPTDNHPTLNI